MEDNESGLATAPATLLRQAGAWLEEDPDPEARDELRLILAWAQQGAPAAVTELADRFAGPLQFGTAGLRGAMAAGPNRMNRAVVIRAAAGLAAYLTEHGGRLVVVGYDARHRSQTFACDTCAVLTGAGLQALLLPAALPTPVLAFAIRHVGADAGVMVTASHNPPQDNGYKVYLADGIQIVPPADAEISAAIHAVGSPAAVPRAESGWTLLGRDLVEDYVERAASVVRPGTPRAVRVAYTPLHGVGDDVVQQSFARAGFAPPSVVASQARPDPLFPTLPFPNPEAAGALDLAIALAEETDADLVLATDPDADRCGAALPFAGTWRPLRGDEIGALIATHLTGRDTGLSGVLATSIVSSSLLGHIAAARGMGYTRTLTGFKWIARVPDLRFGYEEALGYCVDPDAVRDKDGVTAALLLAEFAAQLREEGRSLCDVLDDLALEFGVHLTDHLAIELDHPGRAAQPVDRLLRSPPQRLGGLALERTDDLAEGLDGLPPTAGLRFTLEDGAWVVVRPSGTEPKLKCYLEVVEPVVGGDLQGARARAASRAAAVRDDVRRLVQRAMPPESAAINAAPTPPPRSST